MSEKPGSTPQQTLYVPWHPKEGYSPACYVKGDRDECWEAFIDSQFLFDDLDDDSAIHREKWQKASLECRADGWRIIKIELPDEPLEPDFKLPAMGYPEIQYKSFPDGEYKPLKWEQERISHCSPTGARQG